MVNISCLIAGPSNAKIAGALGTGKEVGSGCYKRSRMSLW